MRVLPYFVRSVSAHPTRIIPLPRRTGLTPCAGFRYFACMSSVASSSWIGPVGPDDGPEALRLVFGDLAPEEQAQQVATLLTHARSGRVRLDGLLGAYRGAALVGAQLSQVLPGKTALVWPPRVLPGEPRQTADRLMAAACEGLGAGQVRLAYALLENVSEADDALLRSAAFAPLAELLYLVAPEGQFPASPPASPLEFEPYGPPNHARLARIVEDTYEHTLDCPRLNHLRAVEDVLEGYRATGAFDPALWLLVRHGGRDVGCLLLADHPEHGNLELVYMGLAARARGNGWGTHVARHAQWLARRAERARLVLAVDADNAPAIRMYAQAGFQEWDRRAVYAKVFLE